MIILVLVELSTESLFKSTSQERSIESQTIVYWLTIILVNTKDSFTTVCFHKMKSWRWKIPSTIIAYASLTIEKTYISLLRYGPTRFHHHWTHVFYKWVQKYMDVIQYNNWFLHLHSSFFDNSITCPLGLWSRQTSITIEVMCIQISENSDEKS